MDQYEQYEKNPRLKRLTKGLRAQVHVYTDVRRNKDLRRRFLIFAQGRTGSTLLRTLLSSHPDIQCDDEILYFPVVFPKHFVCRKALTSSKKVYGFNVKIYQLTSIQRIMRPRKFVLGLAEEGWSIIFLRRNNILRQSISNIYAEEGNKYHYYKSDHRSNKTIVVDCEQVVRMMERRNRYSHDELVVLRDLAVHKVDYERDLLDPATHQSTMDRVFEFLKLPSAPVKTDLVRSIAGTLENSIENYDELKERLKKTDFEKYLYDENYG